jgi:glycosyltransferase involved in cell wall biosynthesis
LPLVLYDGPLTAAGGLDAALEAVRTLLEGGLGVRFVALGRGEVDRRYLERCRLLAAPLANRLLVLEDASARTVIPSWYERADVVCLPARRSVDPMPAKLAAVSATPIIATEVESVLEYVDDETGLLVPVDDPLALYTGLLRVVRDPALADRFAAAASRRADRELSRRTAARRLVELWKTAVTRVAELDGAGAASPTFAAGARGR